MMYSGYYFDKSLNMCVYYAYFNLAAKTLLQTQWLTHIVYKVVPSLFLIYNLFVDTVKEDCAKIIFDFILGSCVLRKLIMLGNP